MEASPWTGWLRGKPFPGEVVRARDWRPELEDVPQGVYFRLLLPQGGSLPPPQDPRVGVVSPARGRALRESGAGYAPAKAPPWEKAAAALATHLLEGWEREQWNRRLAWLRLLCPGLSEAPSPAEVARQEGELLAAVSALKERLASLPAAIVHAMGEARERLSGLPISSPLELLGYLGVVYPSPGALERDLALVGKAESLVPHLPALEAARRYLDEARPQGGELALDRASLLEQLSPAYLVENPHLWESLEALFAWFRDRYRGYYTDLHRGHHQELASLRAALEQAQPRLQALLRLNSIPELGEPVGEGLEAEGGRLLAQLQPCSGEPAPEEACCQRCGFQPGTPSSAGEVGGWLDRLGAALGEQQRRLASRTVHRILAEPREKELDQFLRALRAGDLSPLVHILDDEMVAFLRRLLAEERVVVVVKCLALEELRQQFPQLEEAQIEALLAQLFRRLRREFRQARRQHPDKVIRLEL